MKMTVMPTAGGIASAPMIGRAAALVFARYVRASRVPMHPIRNRAALL